MFGAWQEMCQGYEYSQIPGLRAIRRLSQPQSARKLLTVARYLDQVEQDRTVAHCEAFGLQPTALVRVQLRSNKKRPLAELATPQRFPIRQRPTINEFDFVLRREIDFGYWSRLP